MRQFFFVIWAAGRAVQGFRTWHGLMARHALSAKGRNLFHPCRGVAPYCQKFPHSPQRIHSIKKLPNISGSLNF